MARPRVSLEQRFWEKVDKRGPDDCWEWQGVKVYGYGQIRGDTVMLYAHRVSWELANGPIPEDKCVLHLYDNRSCVNPRHLWIGTKADNTHDMVQKCRSARGERNGISKLTEQDVHEIRQMLSCGISQRVIAKKYGVDKATISLINTGETWGWLKEKEEKRSRDGIVAEEREMKILLI